ncbi:AtpZ/AtpI family protein [Celerinatantimonas yamalensis]|uniref:AtpZ/AtpI family protein n=1 Tax=Celerinatantimonas yamalensis TaxID=559956 RepID=A0ABW9G509_9GAMM
MTQDPKLNPPNLSSAETQLEQRLGRKVCRKLKARRNGTLSVWFGLGMMGLIGWSIAVPTLLGAWLGLWLDKHYPGGHIWTLALIVAGLAIGCLNAWHWMFQEDRSMHPEQDDKQDNDNEHL